MFERVFLDTNPLIYIINGNQPYKALAQRFIKANRLSEFYTSTITDTEFLVLPYRERDFEAVSAYNELLSSLNILKCFVTDAIADRAAKIRAEYPAIKLGDSIQLAASIDCACDAFLTNDAQLKQVAEANVVYLGDL